MKQLALKPSGQSMVGRALQAKKTFHVPDMNADAEYAAYDLKRMGGYRAVLGIPLMREGIPIGAMMVGRQTPKAFTEAQIALVTTFADQAVIAIENVRLFDEVQARTRELAASLEELRTTQDRLVQTQQKTCLTWSANCRYRPRDRESAQFRQQFFRYLCRTDRRIAGHPKGHATRR